jgi:CRP-like cAMP-binding protein
MDAVLRRSHLLEGLDEVHVSRLTALARRRSLEAGERLFELGAEADRVFVVVEGTIELCVPLSIYGTIQEIAMESKGPGSALGWSAFVKPYRFRLSARATGPATVASFDRESVARLFEDDPSFGCRFLGRIAEIISERLLRIQVLWARELQRAVAGGVRESSERPPGPAGPG